MCTTIFDSSLGMTTKAKYIQIWAQQFSGSTQDFSHICRQRDVFMYVQYYPTMAKKKSENSYLSRRKINNRLLIELKKFTFQKDNEKSSHRQRKKYLHDT